MDWADELADSFLKLVIVGAVVGLFFCGCLCLCICLCIRRLNQRKASAAKQCDDGTELLKPASPAELPNGIHSPIFRTTTV
ncbi:hypothetical protein AAVH_40056 [Aphelenchoides avenae]|nr:hypothetical protein AAVH_40056 [Aphelenchus avenae]